VGAAASGNGAMKKKISITLCESTLDAIDRRSGAAKNRSDFIETAVRAYLSRLIPEARSDKDLAIIAQNADRLNREAADVLAFQVIR
jgi:metal-responsive CopG/Arc/MetJ family transcriptional regulator